MHKELECPYCDHEFDMDHDDGFGYEQDVTSQIECPECSKLFVFTTSISFHYCTSKADCLNNGEHVFEITHTCPKEFSKMRCSMCEEERELTEQERYQFNIGTKKDFLDHLTKN